MNKITKHNGSEKVYFCSDPHFGHKNLIKGLSNWEKKNDPERSFDPEKLRKFSSVDHMNSTIINNINSVVGINDTLYCLGDWVFGTDEDIFKIRNQIVCKNVHLIFGNHDQDIVTSLKNQSAFTSAQFYKEIEISKERIVLFHYPIEEWNKCHRGSFHLFGHSHNVKQFRIKNGKKMDVGFDGNDYMPIEWSEVYALLKDREKTKHH